jgi:hypothetical protein
MSKSPTKAADFLTAMQKSSGPADAPAPANEPVARQAGPVEVVAAPPPAPKPARAKKVAKPRADLKHFGGYLDDDTLEKIALLRVRLKKDNSDLIKLAIDELHAKHKAKRAFGDS